MGLLKKPFAYCKTCKGRGTIKIDTGMGPRRVTCSDCGGSGRE